MKYLAHDLGDHDCAYIIPFSDLHLGDPQFDEPKFLGYRDWVLAQPNAFVTINGDMINAAIPGSVSSAADQTCNPQEQAKKVSEILRPLFEQRRILCWNDGNHERRIYRVTDGFQVGWWICDKFNQPELYSGDGAYLKLSVGKGENGKRVVYTTYITHGWAGGRRAGAAANAVEDLQKIVLADIYTEGHKHTPIAFTKGYFVPDLQNGNVREIKLTFICGGSFLRWGGYSEQKGYSPSRTGCPRIRLSGAGRKDVHASV